MKARSCSTWMGVLLMVVGFSLSACGNTEKKKEHAVKEKKAEQPMDTVTFIETETVIEVDSVAPDSTQKKSVQPVSKTK